MTDRLSASLATLGYAAKQAVHELDAAMRMQHHVLLVDTRFRPVCSWSAHWTRNGLQQTYGSSYVWRGDWLGNANYARADLPIRLVDAVRGVAWIVEQLEAGTTCILLCACADGARCHRTVIADLVYQQLGPRLPRWEHGHHVMTPDGPGVILPRVSIMLQRMRNRYDVQLYDGTGAKGYASGELEPYTGLGMVPAPSIERRDHDGA